MTTMNAVRTPSLPGTLFCILCAVAYTAYNVCLHEVSDELDSAWVNCVQASVGIALPERTVSSATATTKPRCPTCSPATSMVSIAWSPMPEWTSLNWRTPIRPPIKPENFRAMVEAAGAIYDCVFRLGGQKLIIDAETERIVDNDEAMKFYKREYRKPYEIEKSV